MKATEQYFSVELFIMLCNVVLSFESVDEIRDRSFCFSIFYKMKTNSEFGHSDK